jgi:hypothetical protein
MRGFGMSSWRDVLAAGLALRGVEEATSYGRPAQKVRGKSMAVAGKSDDHFVLMLALERVELLLEMEPAVFFQTPHYVGWPTVLVRYAALPAGELPALLEEAWAQRVPKSWLKG